MRQTDKEQKLTAIIEPIIKDNGLSMVLLQIKGDARGGQILQIMVEDPKTRNVKLDDCATLSREISAILDVEDPISEAFNLEISSPGIDRPLTNIKDFDDFKGLEAKIEIEAPIDGRKRFRGRLSGTKDDNVCIEIDEGETTIPFSEIYKAKLIMNDELLEFTNKN